MTPLEWYTRWDWRSMDVLRDKYMAAKGSKYAPGDWQRLHDKFNGNSP